MPSVTASRHLEKTGRSLRRPIGPGPATDRRPSAGRTGLRWPWHRTVAWAICCALALPGCAEASEDKRTKEGPATATTGARILALGDSYTIGESVPEDERWPVQLTRELAAQGIAAAPPEIIARTGWTTLDLATAVDRAEVSPPYDLVTLLIGVNDQYQGFALEAYPSRFSSLLERAIELAGGDRERVIVVSIPDYSVTPFGQARDPGRIQRELARVNAINREITQGAGVAHVDITEQSRLAASDATLIAPDGLHPSGKMYAEWSAMVLRLAAPRLRGDTRPPS